MIQCGFCGYGYSETEGTAGCTGCPLTASCGKTKCPNCGFEMPKEPGFIRFMRRRFGGRHGKNRWNSSDTEPGTERQRHGHGKHEHHGGSHVA